MLVSSSVRWQWQELQDRHGSPGGIFRGFFYLIAFAMPARRFPPPWTVEEQDACFVVRDHNGQQLAYVYFEDEPGGRSVAKLLTKDEARRMNQPVA